MFKNYHLLNTSGQYLEPRLKMRSCTYFVKSALHMIYNNDRSKNGLNMIGKTNQPTNRACKVCNSKYIPATYTVPLFKFIVSLSLVTACYVIFGFYMVKAMEISMIT